MVTVWQVPCQITGGAVRGDEDEVERDGCKDGRTAAGAADAEQDAEFTMHAERCNTACITVLHSWGRGTGYPREGGADRGPSMSLSLPDLGVPGVPGVLAVQSPTNASCKVVSVQDQATCSGIDVGAFTTRRTRRRALIMH